MVSREFIEDVRANVGKLGYPGGCPTCMGLGTNPGHRLPQGHDTIFCIGCEREGQSADHNHVLCWECEGVKR